jgi:hypothetical protein
MPDLHLEKKNDLIDCIVHDDGSKCEDQQGIKGMVHEFYENLFSSKLGP